MSNDQFGPLEPLLQDSSLWSIMVNGTDPIYVSREAFRIEQTEQRFESIEQLMQVINNIVEPLGRQVNESHPIVEVKLQDGTLVTIVVPPIAVNGPIMHIYLPAKEEQLPTWEVLTRVGSISEEMVDFLRACIKGRLNVAVSGATGSGKTTLLTLLTHMVQEKHRLIVVEKASDLLVRHQNYVRLEARPANIEGKGEITQEHLINVATKLHPDRIICTEVFGKEIYPFLNAMNSGTEGCMFSIHANDVLDCLTRLEMMATAAQPSLPLLTIRQLIASSLNLVVHIEIQKDGWRRVMKVSEVVGMDGHMIDTRDIFEFVKTGEDENGKIVGEYRKTGYAPQFLKKLELYGDGLPEGFFE